MKKFLVVLLALAMILGLATTAMAADTQIQDYSDTTTSTQYAADIYRLTALGVLCGDTGWGGAYRPDSNITRAEFAKIVCYLAGKQNMKDYYKAQQSAFSDVAEGHWAEGFINCCNANGLMVGVGGGKFAPEANVTKQEVAAAVLRAVGYDGKHLPGNWPNNYIDKSRKVHTIFEELCKDDLSLYEYVEKIDGTAATRAEMAAIVNYCLDLFSVEYVGNQTVVVGLSDVDTDGFAYKQADTNEPSKLNYSTLLGEVFHAYVVPGWKFQKWSGAATPYNNNQLLEASGWGYEDFAKGELIFAGYEGRYLVNDISKEKVRDIYYNDEEEVLPVATDYYIFDKYLDGELWQLGNRYAFLTVQYSGKIINGDEEVLFAEMLSDVNYTDADTKVKVNGTEYANADIFSNKAWGDDTKYDAYDYDNFAHKRFAIVKDVTAKEVVLDYAHYGIEPDLQGFCIKDGKCDAHKDRFYVILKDGKLQDPSCLKVDDVVYCAGRLAMNDSKDPVYLYIAYSPVAGTLQSLATPGDPTAEYSLTVSGDKYKYCYNNDWHQYSEGGYAADAPYANMTFETMMKYVKDDCLYTIGYGKLYVATMIFDAKVSKDYYGVITKVATEFDYIPANGSVNATGMTFFGPDASTPSYDFDKAVRLGNIFNDESRIYRFEGALVNYSLDKDDKIKANPTNSIGAVRSGDVGYVVPTFIPRVNQNVEINDNGRFVDYSVPNALRGRNGGNQSFQYMQITDKTLIFEVKGDWEDGQYSFDSVKLGDPKDYKGHTVTAAQMNIFAWDGREITVLYVREPHFNGDIIAGVFTLSEYDGNYKFTFEDGTVLTGPESGEMDVFAGIASGKRYYGIYKMQDGEVSSVVLSGTQDTVANGQLVVLFSEDGGMINRDSIYSQLRAYNDGEDDIHGMRPGSQWEVHDNLIGGYEDAPDGARYFLTDDTEYIDMSENGGFDLTYFTGDADHPGTDAPTYRYVVVFNAQREIIQIFRFEEGTNVPTFPNN